MKLLEILTGLKIQSIIMAFNTNNPSLIPTLLTVEIEYLTEDRGVRDVGVGRHCRGLA
jgi:hypothetical protein